MVLLKQKLPPETVALYFKGVYVCTLFFFMHFNVERLYSSEREYSGLHIVRPSPGKIVNELFKEAREHGAVPLNEAPRASGDNKSKVSAKFKHELHCLYI